MLIGIAVLLAAAAAWRLASWPRETPRDARDPDAARIAVLQREKNITALAREVSNPNVEVARHAVAALGRIGAESMEQVKHALSDTRPRVRERAAATFAHVARREDAAPLAKLVREDASANVRAAAVSGLERMFAYEQMETILAAMEDPDVAVRRRAAVAARRFACVIVGYKADAPPHKRKAAVQRMRSEWLKHRDRARKYWEMILTKYKKDG